MPDNIMGDNLRSILKQRGLSVQAVSIKSGISHATITRMIRGDGSARVQAWMAVCEALGVSMDEITQDRSTTPMAASDALDSGGRTNTQEEPRNDSGGI